MEIRERCYENFTVILGELADRIEKNVSGIIGIQTELGRAPNI